MSIYVIPVITTSLIGYTFKVNQQKIQEKTAILKKRLRDIQSHFEYVSKNRENLTLLDISRITSLALDRGNIPWIDQTQLSSLYSEEARCAFSKNFDISTFPRISQKIKWAYKISVVAQAILCITSPLSRIVRLLSLIATIVPCILFNKRIRHAISERKQALEALRAYQKNYATIRANGVETIHIASGTMCVPNNQLRFSSEALFDIINNYISKT